jgi:peptide/nickel transport system ATP-binding protein
MKHETMSVERIHPIHPTPIFEVRDLRKYYPARQSGLWAPRHGRIHALDGVGLELMPGELLALVGESGSGKSTLLRMLIGLERPSTGRIVFEGREITRLSEAQLNALRRRIQMVFQDPYESLNPTMTVGEIVAEPLAVHGLAKDKKTRDAQVERALEDVGLTPADAFIRRRPHELSGGQRQRVAVAGALVPAPDVLLADEPVSMLDVSVRAEILSLLDDLRRTREISVLLVTHDMSTAAHIADRVAVMYLGRIVEVGPTQAVLRAPVHPYTCALLSAVPVPNPRQRRPFTTLPGEPPDPVDLPGGCRFHPRCPVAFDRCRTADPSAVKVGDGHFVACLRAKAAGI